MNNYDIKIGKGESVSILFRLTDTDSVFLATDKILFAIKTDITGKEFIHTYEAFVGDLTLSEGVYSFLVPITTELSRSWSLRTYYYDLTLIDANGEEKPLLTPQPFTISGTIGASLVKGV